MSVSVSVSVCVQARDEVAELQKQLTSYERDKVSLAVSRVLRLYSQTTSLSLSLLQNAKARLKVQESELKSLRWEHEVLEQRFAQVRAGHPPPTTTPANLHRLLYVCPDPAGER